mmetsp:Transcript_61273/g.107626  ORF Transcript_61273/g.107626 Transcript_61273/m.107626 type:complete len:181 (-) Transcript_61273:135-677(-)
MSRFAKLRQNVRSALGRDGDTNEEETTEPTIEELEKEEEESRKHEYRLMIILEKVRDIYFQRKLVGSIEISRSFLATSNSISCDVDGTTEADSHSLEAHGPEENKIPLLAKVTITNATRLLNRMEVRARHYRSKAYKEDLSISGSINITDPLGFTSVSISCSASMVSLLTHGGENGHNTV